MTNKKTEELERVPCIWYPVTFKDQTEALLDSESEANAISQAFAQQLGLKIRKTNVGAQKIDGTTLETYGMVVSMEKRGFSKRASYCQRQPRYSARDALLNHE